MRRRSMLAIVTKTCSGLALLPFLWPGASGQMALTGKAVPAVTTQRYSSWQDHPAPCGWATVLDAAHPERPRKLIATTDTARCDQATKRVPIVLVASTLSMIYTSQNASALVSVSALESGAVGDVIRCRSSMDGSVILGRVLDSQSVEMLSRDRKTSW